MYGLTPPQMFLVWFAVTMLLGGGVLLLACIIEAWSEQVVKWKRRGQYAAPPEPLWVWTPPYELIDQLADEGEEALWRDRDLGKEYPLPKERAA